MAANGRNHTVLLGIGQVFALPGGLLVRGHGACWEGASEILFSGCRNVWAGGFAYACPCRELQCRPCKGSLKIILHTVNQICAITMLCRLVPVPIELTINGAISVKCALLLWNRTMSMDDKLLPHRDAIDAIDRQILTLLNERATHARAIGALKGTGAVYRPEREAQVLRRIKDLNEGPLPDEGVARLFREVMSECLAVERPLTIAYLGPMGTFTQMAAIKHFGHAAVTVPCTTVDDSVRLVEARQADYAVAPVENSTEGSVGRTLDLLVNTPLQACGEVVLRIHHHFVERFRQPEKREEGVCARAGVGAMPILVKRAFGRRCAARGGVQQWRGGALGAVG